MAKKVAVVTGANKGIGFAIVRGLCKRFDGDVFLTSRDEKRGKTAIEDLEKENLHPKFHQLDITKPESVEVFRDFVKQEYGGIDILVNNAAIAYKQNDKAPASEQAEQTIFVNYFSLLSNCQILEPVIKKGGRIVNLSSSAGRLANIPSEELKKKLRDPNLTIPELSKLMNQYVEDTKQGTQVPEWGNSSYVVSKVGATALSKILQRQLNNRNIKVNAVHPGYVDTDMSSHKGPMSIDEGATAPLFLALDAPNSVRGEFVWSNCEIVNWDEINPTAKEKANKNHPGAPSLSDWALTKEDWELAEESAIVQRWCSPGAKLDSLGVHAGRMRNDRIRRMPRAQGIPFRRQPHWWTQEIKELRKLSNAARRAYTRCRRRKSPIGAQREELESQLKAVLKQASDSLKKAIDKSKKLANIELQAELDQTRIDL